MPAIRPDCISNRVSLAYEIRAEVFRLIPEDRAIDSDLAAVIDELSPSEKSVASFGAQHELSAWADELVIASLASIGVSIS